MHALLVPVGSHGDVHPFLGLGLALKARGHRVTMIVNEYFGPLVRGLGLDHVRMIDDPDVDEVALFRQSMEDPDLWHPRRAFSRVAAMLDRATRAVYHRIAELAGPGETVAVGGSLAFGVRLAGEALGLPTAAVHLQPGIFHSNFDTPTYVPALSWLNRGPRWLKRAAYDAIYGTAVDPLVAPGLNAFRAELGLSPVRDVMRTYIHDPRLTLGLFPAWFGPPQPDWPPNVRLVGFPLYDERDATPLPDDLAAFLDAGDPPVAFTPGSANLHGRPFFEAAIDACKRLGRRGVLLTRHAEQVPGDLPERVVHCRFAPFGLLLPRCSAIVHHGGLGTAAQGMACSVPQLVMPLAHDQFDNVARMARLGVARSLLPKHFRGPAVAALLGELTGSPKVAANCRAVAAKFAEAPRPLDAACLAIEHLMEPAAVRA